MYELHLTILEKLSKMIQAVAVGVPTAHVVGRLADEIAGHLAELRELVAQRGDAAVAPADAPNAPEVATHE